MCLGYTVNREKGKYSKNIKGSEMNNWKKSISWGKDGRYLPRSGDTLDASNNDLSGVDLPRKTRAKMGRKDKQHRKKLVEQINEINKGNVTKVRLKKGKSSLRSGDARVVGLAGSPEPRAGHLAQ